MLRTTISKIKKICTLGFVPRILRGDVRYPPGKFEKFSLAVLRKAQKSTKSTKDRDAECEKCKRIIERAFGPNLPQNTLDGIKKTDIPEVDIQTMQDMHSDNLTHMVAPQVHVKLETECEKCDRIISEAFGEEDTEKKDILENVSKIPIEDIRLQATTAKTNEEKLTQKIEIINETPLVEAETPKVEGFNVSPRVLGNSEPNTRSNDFVKYSEHAPFQGVALKTLDESLLVKNNQSKIDFNDHTKAISESGIGKDRAVFEDCLVEGYQEGKIVDDLAVHDISTAEETAQKKITLHVIIPNELDAKLSGHIEQPKLGGVNYESDVIKEKHSDEKRPVYENCFAKGYHENNPKENLEVLHSATVTENIRQKTQLVETAKSANPQGLNFSHGNLEKRDSTLNFSTEDSADSRKTGSSPETDIQVTLDELAKRCLDCPNNQIDKRLVKEMEKLGIPQTGSNNTFDSPVMDNEFVQMDVLRKPRKPVKKSEIDLEPREFHGDPPAFCVLNKLYPSFNIPHSQKDLQNNDDIEGTTLKSERIQIYNLDTKPLPNLSHISTLENHLQYDGTRLCNSPEVLSTAEKHTDNIENCTESERPGLFATKPKYNLNQVIIDPYDKKTLAHDTEEYNNDDSLYYSAKTAESMEEKSDISKAFEEEHAKAYHSSSTEAYHTPPILAVETSRLKEIQLEHRDAESIYRDYETARENTEKLLKEQSNIPSSVREQYSHSFIQPETMVNPLLDKGTFTNSKSCDEEVQKNLSHAIQSLPNLGPNKEVLLSEMLKRVRQRNHFEYCRAFNKFQATEVDPAEGKCGKKSPPCPPPAPKCPPPEPCPPPPCPPPPPPCPKPCKPACPPPCPPPSACPPPKKKSPCDKFKKKCSSTLGMLLDLCPQTITHKERSVSMVACNFNKKSLKETASISRAVLTDEVVFHLHNLGSKLLFSYRCCKLEALDSGMSLSGTHSENIKFAKDYEPWTPIPSWPIPQKEVKRTFVCPKEGCKLIPPPKLHPPCKENPCINFPKRN